MIDLSVNLLLVGCAFLLAGFVKGVIGMGLPTVSVGVLSIALAPAQAAALMIAPSLVTNVWQAVTGGRFVVLVQRFWSLLALIGVGIWIGAGVLTGDAPRLAAGGLGLCLALYALIGLSAVRFSVSRRAEPWLSPMVGLLSGLIAGATGIFVIPAIPYLQALDMKRDELIQTMGLSFVVSTIMLAVVLVKAGILHGAMAGTSALAILPAVIGMMIGQAIRSRVPEPLFRVCFFLGMLALGTHLILGAALPLTVR